MSLQAQYYVDSLKAEVPTDEQMRNILSAMEDSYAPIVGTLDKGWDGRVAFAEAVRKLTFTSSPGWPHCNENPTIGGWLGFDGAFCCDQDRLEILWLETVRVLNGDFDTYWRTFVKPEPHKLEKAQEGRWRLILMPPLPVQVAWQMVFGAQNSREIDAAYTIPSQQGMKPCGGGWKQHLLSWKEQGLNHSSDKSAWDWSCPGWMLQADLIFRSRMLRGDEVPRWEVVAKRLYTDAFRDAKLLLSGGTVYKQVSGWGVQKTGCVNTISTNSHCQVFAHLFYSLLTNQSPNPLPVVCGDDTIQGPRHSDIEVFRRMGVRVKHVHPGIEFMGNTYATGYPEPLYYSKHLYSLIHANDDVLEETLESYCRLYAHSADRYRTWVRVAMALGLQNSLKSREYYKNWYDVSEDWRSVQYTTPSRFLNTSRFK